MKYPSPSARRPGGWRTRPVWSGVGLAAAACGLGLLSLLLATSVYGRTMFWSYFTHPAIAIMNLFPVVLAAFVLWFVFGRAWAAYALTGAAVLGLSIANYYKLMFRNDPVQAADLGLAAEGADMVGQYLSAIDWKLVFAVVCFAAGWIFLALCCRGRPTTGWKKRAGGAAVLAALLLGLYRLLMGGGYVTNVVWYHWTANEALINRWAEAQVYVSKGFIYPFLHSIPAAGEQKPAGYNEADAKAALLAHPDEEIPEEQKINVISIMLEGFSDLTRLADLPLTADPYADFHAFEAESRTGRLVTNIFAAGTVDTERGHITGMWDFGNLRSDCWSYARYFKTQGYRAEGGHPGHDWFYNRVNVADYLGFDDYYFAENRYAAMAENGEIAMDDVFLPDLADRLNEVDEPLFSFNVTYQNHGPYPTDRLTGETEYIARGTVSDESYYILNNYLSGVASTAAAITDLTDTLRESEEPVALVVYGDHNPWLGDGNSVYNELDFDFDLDTVAGFENYYGTRYAIWLNPAAEQQLGKTVAGQTGRTVSPCFLMTEVFDTLGWEGPALTRLSRALIDRVPVLHSSGAMLCDGNLTREVPAELESALRDYEFAVYYLRRHADGL